MLNFFDLMFVFDGIMNFSRNERRWSFASSDCAYSNVFASAGNDGLMVCCSVAMDPIFTSRDDVEGGEMR